MMPEHPDYKEDPIINVQQLLELHELGELLADWARNPLDLSEEQLHRIEALSQKYGIPSTAALFAFQKEWRAETHRELDAKQHEMLTALKSVVGFDPGLPPAGHGYIPQAPGWFAPKERLEEGDEITHVVAPPKYQAPTQGDWYALKNSKGEFARLLDQRDNGTGLTAEQHDRIDELADWLREWHERFPMADMPVSKQEHKEALTEQFHEENEEEEEKLGEPDDGNGEVVPPKNSGTFRIPRDLVNSSVTTGSMPKIN